MSPPRAAMTPSPLEDGRAAPDLELPAPRGLYVHFPFCPHRCHYCDYAARGAARPPVEAWLDALTAELRLRCGRPEWEDRPRLETISVGGGTPSLLGGSGVEALGERLRRHFRWEPSAMEWTVEANPESLDRETAVRWREAGVTRVTVGVQSFREEALGWLGRLHGPEEALRALSVAREAGFPSVNADVMYGLPEEGGGPGAVDDARRLARAGVEHVSLYGLQAAGGTHLGRWVEDGRVAMPDGEAAGRAYLEISRTLEGAGYHHYEVTNLARPGHESRHNRATWDGTPYLGIGPSSHSWLPPLRLWNERRWAAYRNAARSGAGPVRGAERLDEEARRLERIWLSLRRRAGLSAGDPLLDRMERSAGDELEAWEENGWIRRHEGGLSPTPRGWLRLDDLVSTLASRLDN